jgi:hypothetical protein
MHLRIKLSGKLNCFDSCDPGSDAVRVWVYFLDVGSCSFHLQVHLYYDHGHVVHTLYTFCTTLLWSLISVVRQAQTMLRFRVDSRCRAFCKEDSISWKLHSDNLTFDSGISCSSKTLQGASSHILTVHATRPARSATPSYLEANLHRKISDSVSSPSVAILPKTRASAPRNSRFCDFGVVASNLAGLTATGGGDGPEAQCDALSIASTLTGRRLGWQRLLCWLLIDS